MSMLHSSVEVLGEIIYGKFSDEKHVQTKRNRIRRGCFLQIQICTPRNHLKEFTRWKATSLTTPTALCCASASCLPFRRVLDSSW